MASPVKTPFTEKEVQSIQTLSGYGLTTEKIAAVFGICKRTFERRLKISNGGVVALSRGRGVAEAAVTQALFEMAISKKCPAATIFWIKCRARWSEPKDVELPPEDGTIKKTVTYTSEWGSMAEAKTPGRDEES